MDKKPREVVLRQMASALRYHNLATDIQVIARAKVPIIKFVCTYGKFNVDISINQANGLQAAAFVNRWLDKLPSLHALVMIVKQLLQQRALSEVFTGGLGSYSVTLLVLSFLQVRLLCATALTSSCIQRSSAQRSDQSATLAPF